MMDEGDKAKIDAQFSLLDARLRKRRRSSVFVTLMLVIVTGALVLQLARDIVEKQAQVQRVEKSRGDLDQQLKSEQEKLDTATRTREKLESEIKQLEATKKTYQDRILKEKDAHNFGPFPEVTAGTPNAPRDPNDAQLNEMAEAASRLLIIEEIGKTPPGFFIKPDVSVNPTLGFSGREIFKVQVSLTLPEAKRGDVESVTYHLSPKFYLKNEIEGGEAPTFDAKFNVFACESTVLVRVKLRDGTTLAVDFDWCTYEGWPARKKEPVIVTSEDEKTPTNIALTPRAPAQTPTNKPPTNGTAAPPSRPHQGPIQTPR